MENSLAIANYFINKANSSGAEITPMKVVKLVYIANGWYLGLVGQPLINEPVEAWKYGPVVPSVYHEFKKFGGKQVTDPAQILSGHDDTQFELQDRGFEKFLDKIWEVYGIHDGIYLSAITHKPGTPWYVTWNKYGNMQRHAEIPTELISSHYKQLASR